MVRRCKWLTHKMRTKPQLVFMLVLGFAQKQQRKIVQSYFSAKSFFSCAAATQGTNSEVGFDIVISHIWMSHANASSLTYKCVSYMNEGVVIQVFQYLPSKLSSCWNSYTNTSRSTYEYVISHACISYVSHMDESCYRRSFPSISVSTIKSAFFWGPTCCRCWLCKRWCWRVRG